MKRWLVVMLVAAIGCRSTPVGTGPPTLDALWRLAPEQATRGYVASGEAITAALTTLQLARTSLEGTSAGKMLAAMLDAAPLRGYARLFASSGIDAQRGAALFELADGAQVLLVGVADEAVFRSSIDELGLTCRRVATVRACSSAPALLDSVGAVAQPPLARAASALPSSLRGNVELLIDPTSPTGMRCALRVRRGAVEGRMIAGQTSAPGPASRSPLMSAIDGVAATGAAVFDLRSAVGAADRAGLTHALGAAFRGDVVVLASATGGVARLPVRTAAEAASVLARCEEARSPDVLAATRRDGGCDLAYTYAPGAPPLELRALLAGDEVRVEVAGGAGRGVPSPTLAELFAEPWKVAGWGRFSLAASRQPAGWIATMTTLDAEMIKPLAARVDELGAAARQVDGGLEIWFSLGTVWRDNDAVLAELEPLLARADRGDDVAVEIAALAARHPRSALAETVNAGVAGVVPGVLAFVGAVTLLSALGDDDPKAQTDAKGPDPRAIAHRATRDYVYDGYSSWAARNGRRCPQRIEDLFEHVGEDVQLDPWGRRYELLCGGDVPGNFPIAVFSRGPDGAANTDDDIRSWK